MVTFNLRSGCIDNKQLFSEAKPRESASKGTDDGTVIDHLPENR